MRKLASIQIVNAAEPIPNADAIEKIRVLGWWVVVKKGEHRPGDKVVYCEIDSLLPERPEFEFLRAGSFKPAQTDDTGAVVQPAGFRIRTVKLRGQISQGICFPLSVLPPGAPADDGADVTDWLAVRKWEPPSMAMRGRVKGGFPGFLPKTDEIRVQVLEPVLAQHRGKTFYVTEKLDGMSFTAFLRDGQYGICSRNQWMDETDSTNVLARVAQRLQLEEKLRAIEQARGFQPAIQAEVIGLGVQKNKYALKEVTLRVFNVLDIGAGRLVDHAAMIDILRGRSGGRAAARHADPQPHGGRAGRVRGGDERLEPQGAARGRGSQAARRGVRRGHWRPAELQGNQPEVLAQV